MQGNTPKTSDSPLISVVLATKGNKTELLEKCLNSLRCQTFKQFELILVYSIYPKGLDTIFQELNIITMKETGRSLGAARNLGVKNARSEIISFIDDDAEAPEEWLSKVYSTFQKHPEIMCLGGAHLTPVDESKKNPLRFVEGTFAESQMAQIVNDRYAVGKIAGCNVSYKKSAFNTIGFLNEKMRSGEDWDYHMRLTDKGYHIRFEPSVFVWHHRQGLKHAFLNCANMVPFFFSRRTLKYSKYESFFALFYLSNALLLFLIAILFFSRIAFIVVLALSLLSHFILTALRTKAQSSQLIYYPLSILFTLARLLGFYYGILRSIKNKIVKYFFLKKGKRF